MEKRPQGSSSKTDQQSSKNNTKILKDSPKNPLAMMMKAQADNILEIEYKGAKKKIDKSKIRISHWNVNGIRAALKKSTVREYLEKNELDILCLNETKINKKKFMKSAVKEY
jgi:hypothetical protein